jgi:hypothetical protein
LCRTRTFFRTNARVLSPFWADSEAVCRLPPGDFRMSIRRGYAEAFADGELYPSCHNQARRGLAYSVQISQRVTLPFCHVFGNQTSRTNHSDTTVTLSMPYDSRVTLPIESLCQVSGYSFCTLEVGTTTQSPLIWPTEIYSSCSCLAFHRFQRKFLDLRGVWHLLCSSKEGRHWSDP